MKILEKSKITIFALIISFSLISGGEYWHHHNDSNFDENQCPVCLIIHSFNKVEAINAFEVINPSTYQIFSSSENSNEPELIEYSVLSDRAPPAFL